MILTPHFNNIHLSIDIQGCLLTDSPKEIIFFSELRFPLKLFFSSLFDSLQYINYFFKDIETIH